MKETEIVLFVVVGTEEIRWQKIIEIKARVSILI